MSIVEAKAKLQLAREQYVKDQSSQSFKTMHNLEEEVIFLSQAAASTATSL